MVKELLDEEFVEKNYEKFVAENIKSYLSKLSGFGKWKSKKYIKLLNNILLNQKYNSKKLLAIQNYVECEAHRELLISGLKYMKESKNIKKL